MVRFWIVAMLMLAVDNFPEALADGCSSVQIPVIQNVRSSNALIRPLAAINVTIRTQHKLRAFAYYVSEHAHDGFITAESSPYYTQAEEYNQRTHDYSLKLFTTRRYMILAVKLAMAFELKNCSNILEMSLGIARPIMDYAPLNIGKFVDVQLRSQMVEPGKTYTINYALDTNIQGIRGKARIESYRTPEGAFAGGHSQPIEIIREGDQANPETIRFQWPYDLYYITFQSNPEIPRAKVAPLSYVSLKYYVNMHTGVSLQPVIRFKSCSEDPTYKQPEESTNGTVKVWTYFSSYPCLQVLVHGYPLPEITLHEKIAGTNVLGPKIHMIPEYHLTDTYDKKYFIPSVIIKEGQELGYRLTVGAVIAGETEGKVIHKDVLLIGYEELYHPNSNRWVY